MNKNNKFVVMRILGYILLMLFSSRSLAQYETKETFLNSIEKTILRNCDKHYYLDELARRIYLNSYGNEFNNENKDKNFLKRYIPATVANDLFDKIQKDTISSKWQFDRLPHAIPEPEDLHKIVSSQKYLYDIAVSKPIFDNRNNYAIIAIEETCVPDIGSCYYIKSLYIKKKGKWVKIIDFEIDLACGPTPSILQRPEIAKLPIIR